MSAIGVDHEYVAPTKQIKCVGDMQIWDKSEAYFEYLGFVLAINEAVQGLSNAEGSKNPSPEIVAFSEMLDDLSQMVDEIPPVEQPQRFGNQAFRIWYQKLKDNIFDILQKMLPKNLYRAVPEIMEYLIEGFGNATRIDYGTGHEISFLMFVCSLFKIGFLNEGDKPAAACLIFAKYLVLVRKLQTTYRMEPAGSHGVWSLDDYQFVPFIWGSSQLIRHPSIEPSSFYNDSVVAKYAYNYLFLSCIEYINQVKTGPFAEHSNQLWSISGVSTWSKINSGLIKMYKAEVLSKFPLVQHIVFGSLFTLKPANLQSTVRAPPLDPFKRPSEPSKILKTPDSTSESDNNSNKQQIE